MAARDELQPLFLLSDEPIEGHSGDFLSREDDARTIAGAVLGTTGPFSVGVYGEWGTGKTSLLHHVKSLLEAPESPGSARLRYPYLVAVFFNAWQHEKDAAPLAHLAEAVDAAITKRLNEVQSVAGKVSDRAVGWLRSAHLAARSLVYGASVELKATPETPGFKLSAKDAIDQYTKLQTEASDPKSKVWKAHVDQSVTRSVLRSFRADHTLLDKVRPGKEKRVPRVVVFIDDMDRCLPEDAFALLQAIKLALAQPGFVFVMTLDPAALQPHIDKKLKDSEGTIAAGSKAIYLDKLVQLPYPLRLHDDQFAGFVDKIVRVRLKEMLVAPKDFGRVEANASLAPQWQVFRDLARVLDVSSQKNPRTLVRRINGLLVDARVASPALKAVLDKDPAKAEGIFMGLCLIRHTLKHFLGDVFTAQLSAADKLCPQIAQWGLKACVESSVQESSERDGPAERAKEPTSLKDRPLLGLSEIVRQRDLLRELARVRCLDALLRTDAGLRWLGSAAERDLVETFYAKRPAPSSPAPASSAPGPQPVVQPATSDGGHHWNKGGMTASLNARIEQDERQRAIIERAVRGALNLPADAPLGPDEWAKVTELVLHGDPITDAGVEWLTRADSGFSALESLDLGGTQVSDAGVEALAAKTSGLRGLMLLNLSFTQVGDAGAEKLAAKGSGLRNLKALWLQQTKVSSKGAAAFAKSDCGLKSLEELWLTILDVSEEVVEHIRTAHPTWKVYD